MYNNPHTTDPVSISITMHGITHTIDGLNWDATAEELTENFLRLLVGVGFPPAVMNLVEEDGHWEYVNDRDLGKDAKTKGIEF